MKRFLTAAAMMFSTVTLAETWTPPCEGINCKVWVAHFNDTDTVKQLGPAQIFNNGAFDFYVYLAGQTTGPTADEDIFDVDLELYKWEQLTPEEGHSHFHLKASSTNVGTSTEYLSFKGQGQYQIRVKKAAGKAGDVVVFYRIR